MTLFLNINRCRQLFSGISGHSGYYRVIKNLRLETVLINKSKLYTQSRACIAPILNKSTFTIFGNIHSRHGSDFDSSKKKSEIFAFHWFLERLVAIELIGIIPFSFYYRQWEDIEYVLALTTALHMHWGIEAIVIDYIRPSVFGNMIPVVARTFVYFFSLAVMIGLCFLAYTEGLVKSIVTIWGAF